MTCQEIIYSNEYADYIIDITSQRGRKLLEDANCNELINQEYAVIQVKGEENTDRMKGFLNYQNLPRMFGLLDVSHLETSGVSALLQNAKIELFGSGVILGVIDTGIDYTHPAFKNQDGTTRISVIWDQTIKSSEEQLLGKKVSYGTVYDRGLINRALFSDDPGAIVPSKDEIGHGTVLAGIAAGSKIEQEDFQGVAPLCELAVVKLKQAKDYLKRYWLIPEGIPAFQETDIFLSIRFLLEHAYEQNKPLVILMGCGTNSGNHGKSDYLKNYLNYISTFSGKCIVLAAGNEGSLGHHFLGNGLENTEFQDVEIQVEEGEKGLIAEFWADAPDQYTVGFLAPGGEYVEKIPIALSEEGSNVNFIFEPTSIRVFYEAVERTSGDYLIWIRMKDPSPGIWKIRVFKEKVLNGRFDIWLPMEPFVKRGTRFLSPDPDTTICEPGNGDHPLTVTAYDHRNGALFFQASRGYTRDYDIKPDLASPGVAVFGPAAGGGYRTVTGTSAGAAVAAGCAVLLFSFRAYYTGLQIKNLLIKGTVRKQLLYPNREWGYGEINLYESISSLTGLL